MQFKINRKLKAAMVQQGINQTELSAKTKIPPAWISMGINGRYLFDDDQMFRIAEALNSSKEKLFSE